MPNLSRRKFMHGSCSNIIGATLVGFPFTTFAAQSHTNSGRKYAADTTVIQKWMNTWMETRSLSRPLKLSRFVEPIYFLLDEIEWEPNANQSGYKPVKAPRGFVTDLTSIPRVFWSALRPDGDYTYAAILHDYLYWTQTVTRNVADEIFRMGMQDLEVKPVVVDAVYNAVSLFGESAWNENTKAKASGEKRILKQFPISPTTKWQNWKRIADVFSD